ncbi:MAG: hypothetical protein DHS20C19_27880 [Acidimicrobiales bacterium]|nr:MAG: hypothetical protein DHS20C19_27880 [Acidimicrobiales bacterium]
MTVTLLMLAFGAALTPFRAAAASPAVDRRPVALVAVGATFGAIVVVAALSGPLLDLLGVTGATSRIAAGIAMLAVAIKDIVVRPPTPEPALPGRRAGLIPLAFPVLFTPAVAMLAVAGAADRGVLVAAVTALPALALVAGAVVVGPRLGRRSFVAFGGCAATVLAALVTLDGVYAI